MQKRWLILIGSGLILLLAACRQDAPAAVVIPVGEAEVQPTAVAATPESTATAVPLTTTPTNTPEPSPTSVPTPATQFPPAEIVNDEGGPVSITGDVTYTNAFFTMGVAEPVVILEDQAGFVDRNENFIMPVASQTLGQITSDFFESPFSYAIALPIEPGGTLRDVDNDGESDAGVQTFAVAYWTNTFGDPFLEERDLFGGGWSTAYVSTEVSSNAETKREITGGNLLVYAPDDQQGFPSGFGSDGLLFTDDDPIVSLPQGYTIVNLDSDPFTFDRTREAVIDLIEPESAALVDYSDLSYTEAFDALIDYLSKHYAFTEYKNIDWEALRAELKPRFQEADAEEDALLYRRALRDLAWSIPDGHVSGPSVTEDFAAATSGGLGIAVRELDDGRSIVNFLTPGSPADEAGIELGAEIITINNIPIADAISEAVAYSAPFSTEHFKRLQQMRYVTRFPLDAEVTLTFRNPESQTEESVTLTAVPEPDSFSFSSFSLGRTGIELPVEYEILPNGYAYTNIYSFSDNELLTIQLWERLMRTLNDNNIAGLIIDMRQNGGGSGFLADQMAAYFFDESLVLGNTGKYAEDIDDFFFDSRGEERFYPPVEELRYRGPVAVLVGPNCNSACEFFSYDMSLEERAAIVGQYPTGGLGGSVEVIAMPESEQFRFTAGRAVDADGNIHIEGKGVPPSVQVPVDEEALLGGGDAVLETAVAHLNDLLMPDVAEGGVVRVGDAINGELIAGERVEYTLELAAGDIVSLSVASDEFDPLVWFFDAEGNLLAINDNLNESTTTAGFEALELSNDLILIVQVASENDTGQGQFTLLLEAE